MFLYSCERCYLLFAEYRTNIYEGQELVEKGNKNKRDYFVGGTAFKHLNRVRLPD